MRRRHSPPFAHLATASGMARRTSVAARRSSYLRMSRQPTSRVISISRWLSYHRNESFCRARGRPLQRQPRRRRRLAGRLCERRARCVAMSGVVDRRRHSGLADCSCDGAFARRCCPRSTRFAHGLTRVVQVAGKDSRGDQQIVSILRLVDEDMRTAQLATLTPGYPIITRGL